MTYAAVNAQFPNVIPNRQMLYKILRNPIYIGKFQYAKKIFDGEHPPLISQQNFEETQMRLSYPQNANRKPRTRPAAQKYAYLLAGLVRCHCGRFMTPATSIGKGVPYHYYRCTSPTCKSVVHAEKLDRAILSEALIIARDKEFIAAAFRQWKKVAVEEDAARANEIKPAREALKAAQDKRQKINAAFLAGMVKPENADYWKAELAATNATIAEAESEIDAGANR